MEWYFSKTYTMPTDCNNVLNDTTIVPTSNIIIRVYQSISFLLTIINVNMSCFKTTLHIHDEI